MTIAKNFRIAVCSTENRILFFDLGRKTGAPSINRET
jgi:hypothetical protein